MKCHGPPACPLLPGPSAGPPSCPLTGRAAPSQTTRARLAGVTRPSRRPCVLARPASPTGSCRLALMSTTKAGRDSRGCPRWSAAATPQETSRVWVAAEVAEGDGRRWGLGARTAPGRVPVLCPVYGPGAACRQGRDASPAALPGLSRPLLPQRQMETRSPFRGVSGFGGARGPIAPRCRGQALPVE